MLTRIYMASAVHLFCLCTWVSALQRRAYVRQIDQFQNVSAFLIGSFQDPVFNLPTFFLAYLRSHLSLTTLNKLRKKNDESRKFSRRNESKSKRKTALIVNGAELNSWQPGEGLVDPFRGRGGIVKKRHVRAVRKDDGKCLSSNNSTRNPSSMRPGVSTAWN